MVLVEDGGNLFSVLVVVLMVLVEDGGNLFSVLANGQKCLFVVMGCDVELEHVGASSGAGEDTSVSVKTTTNVAVGALEGEVLLTTTIIGLGSVGIEIYSKSLSCEGFQEFVLLHHLGSQILNIALPVFIL